MDFLRTPEEAFAGIRDFDYQPNYVEIDGLRIHYVDEGQGEVILCLHGEPTWSYLYRKFFPVLSPKHRVIAPDFIGFGKSDKLRRVDDYSYSFHFDILKKFVEALELKNITLVVQDWGGLLGLGLLGAQPDWFSRVVIMNTFLPQGKKLPLAFKVWKAFALRHPSLPIGFIVSRGCHKKSSRQKHIKKAYQAPFPSKEYKAAARAFPKLVPSSPEDDGVAQMKLARDVLGQWEKPALVLFSDKDPIMSRVAGFFHNRIPSVKGKPVITIRNASHFLQEDSGDEIAAHILKFMEESL